MNRFFMRWLAWPWRVLVWRLLLRVYRSLT